MAVDNNLPPSVGFNSSSSSTSSSLPASNYRRRFVQVGTNNSATFIQFPRNVRHTCPFIPISHPRIDHSFTYFSAETQSLSSANAPTSSIASGDGENKRNYSQQRTNPILTNPLLNHRKEQPKTPPMKSSKEYSRTTRLCLSSRPFRTTINDTQIPTIRASTAPPIKKESNLNISDRLMISIDQRKSEQQQQQKMQYIDDTKYDYITRWLNEVRAATCSKNIVLSKSKRTKRGFAPS